MKYKDVMVTFSEIPDEITLCVNISGCPIHCPECHSKYLWDNIGNDLTFDTLEELIEANQGITCLCLMGGDQDPDTIWMLGLLMETYHPNIKTAWYSGKQEMPELSPEFFFRGIPFDYIKLGPYNSKNGPLNSKSTNQRMYEIDRNTGHAQDITYKFWN